MTRKKRRLKKEIKKGLYVLFIVLFIICLNVIIKDIQQTQTEIKQQQQTEINNYKQCIYTQHKQNGYIIRSVCSNNWQQLDKKANIKYKQIKKDLYLLSIDNLEI